MQVFIFESMTIDLKQIV